MPRFQIGPYEILALVGKGGMGEVYRAHDPRLGRDVAIKVLKEGHLTSPEGLLRFKREARAIASLNHPHIARLYDIGEDETVHFLVIEYLDGLSLASRLASGPLPLADTVRYGAEIADALDHAHTIGVVHRDLKPANIMITAGGAKLLDFGLAKIIAVSETESTHIPITDQGIVVGTYSYMSPEQFEGHEATPASDIFALGAVLFEMVTGQRAFAGSTMATIAAAVLHDVPPPISRVRSGVLRSLDRLVRKCLAKDPAERCRSAGDVRDELRALRTDSDHGTPRRPRTVSKGTSDSTTTEAGRRVRGVAVMPLRNLSGDAAQDYFADGLTEALITSLAKIGAIKVISRSSAMAYKGSTKPLREIAKELKVDTVLEGSFTRSRDRVGVTLQLVRVTTDSPIWAEQYNRDFTDVLEVQSEVAQAVASAIRVAITPSEKQRLQAGPKVVREAYEEYLRGQFVRRTNTKEALTAAFNHYRRAIELDPRQPLPYVGLARYYESAGLYRLVPYREAFAAGRQAAEQAIALDPSIGGAFSALGGVMLNEWDLAGAQRAFMRALELDPSDASSRNDYARYLMYLGRFDEALRQVEMAEEIDPRSPAPPTLGAFICAASGDFASAIAHADRAINLAPPSPPAQYARGLALARIGRLDEALEVMRAASESSGHHPSTLSGLAYIQSQRGVTDESARSIADLEERHRLGEASAFDMAEGYTSVKRHDEAMAALEKAYQQRAPELLGVAVDPLFAELRGTPAFDQLIRRIGLI